MAQQWLSIVEYARAFSVSDMTVRRRIKTGKLQSVMRDGKYYIPVDVGVDGEYIKPTSPKKTSTRATAESAMDLGVEEPTYDMVRARPQPTVIVKDMAPVEPVAKASSETPKVVAEDKSIVEVCQKMLSKLDGTEELINSRYAAQLNALKSEVKSKDLEIEQLKQQIEDLQVLVKILESN